MTRFFKSLAIAASLLTIALTGCGKTTALGPSQLAEQNKPGTLMIQTVHNAEFSVPDYDLNESKMAQLVRAFDHQSHQSDQGWDKGAHSLSSLKLRLRTWNFLISTDAHL